MKAAESEAVAKPPARLPGVRDAVNAYFLATFEVLAMGDVSGVGTAALASDARAAAAPALAAAAFVLPAAAWSAAAGWDVPGAFGVRACGARAAAACALDGAALWLLLAGAGAASGAWPAALDGAGQTARLVEGAVLVLDTPASPSDALALAALAVGPAAACELLFRGFAMTALQEKISPTNAAVVAAVMYSSVHASLDLAVPYLVVGLAAGFARAGTGSVLAAVALHAGFNAMAYADGALQMSGVLDAGPPGPALCAAAVLAAAASTAAFRDSVPSS